ncbi:MAG: right-handed parallel beta-helix repeat-containing protein [Promethearchaeota archaeon]|nr:MAG: right-handed parallel beta-helix repeat-containing protein [Candidatus Lokiarchaeota archaeon]
MKSNRKAKIIILIFLGILFSFSPIIPTYFNFKSSEFSDDNSLDNEDLKSSKVSGKIHIDDTNPSMNWSVARDMGICTGNGTYSDPYVIEDLIINGGGSGDCILIENSDVYFRIENCTVYNSAIYPFDPSHYWNHFAGIRLLNVNNSLLFDNDCSSNNDGIHVHGFNNSISGNTANNNINGSGIFVAGFKNNVEGNNANNNDLTGIFLGGSNSMVSGNVAMNNSWASIGIMLLSSNYNNVSGNTAAIQLFLSDYNNISENTGAGIALLDSDYNIISGNTASYRIILQDSDYNIVSGNDACWAEIGDCDGNVFSDNNGPCPKEDDFPIELIIIISISSGGAVMVVTTLLLIRRKRKRIE